MDMPKKITGIHHVTAIASQPQRNLDFYRQVLGMRLVKLTVNFDDPGTYHFYFGDEGGSPGTILTFFPWANAHSGQAGNGQAASTAFSIPEGSTVYWQDHLHRLGVDFAQSRVRFGESALTFRDPDGLALELVEDVKALELPNWPGGPVPENHAIRGVYNVELWEDSVEATSQLLTNILGFERVGQDANRTRFRASGNGAGTLLDIIERPRLEAGRMGAGAIHHIAFRTRDDDEQLSWRTDLMAQGYQVTRVKDRQYFHSIYFNEPGGVLFEIATDGPGFAWDESLDTLGTSLKLPPWLEGQRQAIQNRLPQLDLESSREFLP